MILVFVVSPSSLFVQRVLAVLPPPVVVEQDVPVLIDQRDEQNKSSEQEDRFGSG